MCVHVKVEVTSQDDLYSSLDLYLVLETEFLTEPGNLINHTSWPSKPWIPPPLLPQCWDYRCVPLYAAFFMDAEH